MITDLLPLPLFPEGALSASVITTVWVGVLVVAFFNLRFGWVLSGLVVPGYLVPLLLLKPWSVVAILAEGMTTYLLVWLFSERLSRFGAWSALFGRDRFFALVLVSIIVRIGFDGWLLPFVGHWLTESWGLTFDYRNDLHSLGLIIVALVANQFWKTGIWRGSTQLLLILAIAWVLVRYGLMTMTNFGLGGLSYMYEDLAASILASPKAYMILVVTAFVASRMNLHYGWEFNGILIPALLALQWYEPLKILVSFLEAFIILGLANMALRLPFFAAMTMEGARKLLLFFNIGFLYKIALGYLLLAFAPQIKVTDYFAFGYLLSTLLAIKMHDKEIVMRLTRATLQTSLISVFIASLLGWGLTLIPDGLIWQQQFVKLEGEPVKVAEGSLADRIQADMPLLYGQRGATPMAPLAAEIDAFSEAVRLLKRGEEADWDNAGKLLGTLDYRLELIEKRYLLLQDKDPERGWGIYVVDTKSSGGLCLQLPRPLEVRGLLNSALALFESMDARALALGPVNRIAGDTHTLFHAFHRAFGRSDTLQLRGYSSSLRRKLEGVRDGTPDPARRGSHLWVKKRLPPGLNLARLRQLLGGYAVHWGGAPTGSLERRVSRQGFAELLLDSEGQRRLLFSRLRQEDSIATESGPQQLEGYLFSWLAEGRTRIAGKGSNAYRPPRLDELLYLDEEVLTPILQAATNGYRSGAWTEAGLSDIATAINAAAVLGYRLIRYRHTLTGRDYLILFEQAGDDMRYWGTYVFRLGDAEGITVQTPRPLFERNSFFFSVFLFERLEARALLIGGSHPHANLDLGADLVRSSNRRSLFNLVSQVLIREADGSPQLALQCRAFGQRPGQPLPQEDILLADSNGIRLGGAVNPALARLIGLFRDYGWSARLLRGDYDTAGYDVGGLPQSNYLAASENATLGLVWVSPEVRRKFRQHEDDVLLQAQYETLGISRREGGVLELLGGKAASPVTLSGGQLERLQDYLARRDVLQLHELLAGSLAAEAIVDPNSGQAFLVFSDPQGLPMALVNLMASQPGQRRRLTGHLLDNAVLQAFIDSRDGMLLMGGG